MQQHVDDGGYDDQQQHQRIHLPIIEIGVGIGDDAPKSGGGKDELAGDDADESIADGELAPGEEMRCRRRKFQQSAVAMVPMRWTRATLESTLGTRSSPFKVAMIIATIAVATPINTIGMTESPKITIITG